MNETSDEEMNIPDTEERMVQVAVEVPESVRDGAKAKLPYGGMSQVIREELNRVAFGEEMGQRSRLESRLEDVREERDKLQRERRELNAKLENLEDQAKDIERKLDDLTTQEDRYEAKLESLEYNIRIEGRNLFADHGQVESIAAEAGKSPEGVIKDLKHRNPDVPDEAFLSGLDGGGGFSPPDKNPKSSLKSAKNIGYGKDGEMRPLEEREEKYRPRDPDADN
ncbi:hypothetical protein HacjB3_19333 (plasmid) [Halalkalicoccus jeotgali B3]|uniref:Uncharacterized protein n=1 Tax=Halalkalicoccus jeotgali (strain DSM 18796 / CECT 7217 / JCM 14584 / KCTC 4019 / B3) TaxID=795797 RepID=D8JCR4_HALJB|nr:hypothetical protein [Halalkalicoccus jeotgali]ADJ16809.1 hypothetical protein HacjB3_17333 [Halalkalicoccus jeotgali B3]ADJ17203.1 hypothetical protein HacjB3_19333 [Halalkalicoccus jeotgali B3]